MIHEDLKFYTKALRMLKAVCHDSICDLVTDLVGVSCGYLFGSNYSHSLVLLK